LRPGDGVLDLPLWSVGVLHRLETGVSKMWGEMTEWMHAWYIEWPIFMLTNWLAFRQGRRFERRIQTIAPRCDYTALTGLPEFSLYDDQDDAS
jgi:hypothetical protein